MNKKILFISFYFPPIGGSGAIRSLKFCKYLPEFGWDPVVLAPEFDYFINDRNLLDEIKGKCKIIRTGYFSPAPRRISESVQLALH